MNLAGRLHRVPRAIKRLLGQAGKEMATVLVVEDDEGVQEILRAALDMFGHKCEICGDARQAGSALEKKGFDLAILDIMLPGENGVEFSWTLRQQYPQMPILIVSGILERWDEDDIKDCGADRIMPKPLNMSELRQAISELLENGRR